MRDHAREVRNLLTDANRLCSALGWMAGAKRNGDGLLIRCPWHDEKNASCGVTKGPDGTLRAKCHACQESADALGMIAKKHNLDTGSPNDFREVLVMGAEIGGDVMLAEEIKSGQQSTDRKPVPAPEPIPDREYPDQSEVMSLWAASMPVSMDQSATAVLKARAIDPIAASETGCLRVFSPGTSLPAWARYKGLDWAASGHRMIARAVDHNGAVRSVRAWQVDGKDSPKRLPPSGCKAKGLVLANREAAKMLAGKSKPDMVVICEGEPDWATWATRVQPGVAVVGIGSGSWTQEHADRLPKGCNVYVRTDADKAGDEYAAHVLDTIGERCAAWLRECPERGVDENDKAVAGRLPVSPSEGCEPANETAKRIEADKPRVFTVREMMQVAHKAMLSNEPPVMWTSGHWKIDLMTGGLRPDSGWVVGAASNWGKSMFLISLCDENMRSRRNPTVPLIVSGEDSEELYAQRLLARRARVNAMRLRDNCLKPDEHKRIASVLALAEPKPHYLDGRGVTFERLMHQILELVAKYDVRVVALDYIQEFRTKQKYESERVMFREMARVFRHSLKKLKCGSIILTQVTGTEQGKAPNKDNIRECKDIGHGAEVIAMGWEPTEPILDKNGAVLFDAKSKLILLDKTKSGSKGVVGMDWDPVSACFNRVSRPEYTQDEDMDRYEADADTTHAVGFADEFDEAIGAEYF